MSKINSLIVTNGRLDIPLVVIKKGNKLLGFVPALEIESIWGEMGEEDEILAKLRQKAKEKITQMAKSNEPFPFFPDSTSIIFEFSPVKYEFLVAHIKQKANK
ncbi:MAG: hypothetical protein IJZ29_03380 [Clostridia bacterium]|nr:hypothetical protein [Clostridia bacterium]